MVLSRTNSRLYAPGNDEPMFVFWMEEKKFDSIFILACVRRMKYYTEPPINMAFDPPRVSCKRNREPNSKMSYWTIYKGAKITYFSPCVSLLVEDLMR